MERWILFSLAVFTPVISISIPDCRAKDELLPIDGNQKSFYACVGRGSGYVIDCALGTFHNGQGKYFPCGCTEHAPPGEQPECSTVPSNVAANRNYDTNEEPPYEDNGESSEDLEFKDKTGPEMEETSSDLQNSNADDNNANTKQDASEAVREITLLGEIIGNTNKRKANEAKPLLDDPQRAVTRSNSVDNGLISSSGCPDDPFLMYPDMNKPKGVPQSFDSLESCQKNCLMLSNCREIDWNKERFTPNNRRCFFHFTKASSEISYPRQENDCCDHYEVQRCDSQTTPRPGNTNPRTAARAFTRTSTPTTRTTQGLLSTRSPSTERSARVEDTNDGLTSTTPSATTTIPDSGCPYVFQKFTNTSHPSGRSITKGNRFNTVEKCKYWCLITAYCKAVDFDHDKKICYFIRQLIIPLIKSVPGVTHFRKVPCQPTLRCWSATGRVGNASDVSITNINTAQVQCRRGICFVTEDHAKGTITRGCMPETAVSANKLGCSMDPQDRQKITCRCSNDLCNGLSVAALSSQIIYLPLDGDMKDYSGNGRDGTVTSGYRALEFTCHEKVQNCSAQLAGDQCMSVRQLAQFAWGMHTQTNVTIPQATFSVWFKMIPLETTRKEQGIFGNSANANLQPSWEIIAEAKMHRIGAGIDTGYSSTNISQRLRDYKFVNAQEQQWHLATLVYNTTLYPTLRFYLDGIPAIGNARNDMGPIGMRREPVTLGCVRGRNFTGFIDEARIFTYPLEINDIKAILAMRDDNFDFADFARRR